MRNAAATTLAAVLATSLLGARTDGFRAFTAEAARRIEVEHSPRPIPAVVLEDHEGRAFDLSELAGRRVVVSFVYTRCPGICPRASDALATLARRLRAAGDTTDAALLSISFDPERDDPRALRRYAEHMGADGELWRFARPRDVADLPRLLEVFGVVVIPDGFGGYEHNAGLHLVNERGELWRILDPFDTTAAEVWLAAAGGAP